MNFIKSRWKENPWLVIILVAIGGRLLAVVFAGGYGYHDDHFLVIEPAQGWVEGKDVILYSTAYSTEPWYTYLLILLGVFVPPVSFFLLFGFAASYRLSFPTWLGVVLFFVFHSLFPNKQERFIFTIIPHLIVFGYLGWQQFLERSPKWQSYRLFRRGSWAFFWVINLVMLVIYSTYYNKQSRVEGLQYLADRGDAQALLMVDLHRTGTKHVPLFYLEKSVPVFELTQEDDIRVMHDSLYRLPVDSFPNYVVVMQKQGQDISDTPPQLRPLFSKLTYLETFPMSFVDRVRNGINRSIKLDDWAIYRAEPYPNGKSLQNN